jgi:predicted nucleotidyltransferase
MKDQICAELARVEREHSVRVLMAVESGSRAWGFASPDSDYDVRFVYAHSADWYLSVFEGQDVIEKMLSGNLDVSGWDLRKTLRLFSKCNFALNEWLGSSIVYVETEFRPALAGQIPNYFNGIKAIHHYRSMAERSLTENLVDGEISIKKLFYILRPLLACRWIRETQTQPPTALAELIVPPWVTPQERDWFGELLKRKATAAEAEPVRLEEDHAKSMRSELESHSSAAEFTNEATPSRPSLDKFFRRWIE